MTRPARVIIDLEALRHNLARARRCAPRSRVMAVVKADAYGHGLTRAAAALEDADGFGVACLEEARELRDAGATQKILLLEGPYCGAELADVRRLGLDIVIHHHAQLDLLDAAPAGAPINVWLKIDSGMHRLGFDPAETPAALARLERNGNAAAKVRLISHLANAGAPQDAMTRRQVDLFMETTEGRRAERSLANSAAMLAWPECCLDWVRPGLMLYGASPIPGAAAADFDLNPVMTLESALISVKRVRRGEPVGYGAGWRCPEDLPIGVVAAGYGDGYPRRAPPGTPVLVAGKPCALAGKPSMDMLTVDLRGCPGARVGAPVLLWGRGLPVEKIAECAATVPYELLCGVHKRLEVTERG